MCQAIWSLPHSFYGAHIEYFLLKFKSFIDCFGIHLRVDSSQSSEALSDLLGFMYHLFGGLGILEYMFVATELIEFSIDLCRTHQLEAIINI